MNTISTTVAPLTEDNSVTSLPYTIEEARLFGCTADTAALYRLASPLFGADGEEAHHLIVTVVEADGGSVSIVAADAEKVPFVSSPALTFVRGTTDGDAVLAGLGYVVTEGAE